MITVGRGRLDDAIKSGQIPPVPARCWFAEACDARWLKAGDVLEHYKGTELVGKNGLVIPLDEAGHCVGVLASFVSGALVIIFAGHRRDNPMGNGKAGRS